MDVSNFFANDRRSAGKAQEAYQESIEEVYRKTPSSGPFSNWDGVLRLWDMYCAGPDFDSSYDGFPSWAQAEIRN